MEAYNSNKLNMILASFFIIIHLDNFVCCLLQCNKLMMAYLSWFTYHV